MGHSCGDFQVETQNSLSALSILAGGTAITMLTDEWTNNPLRVAAAAHARRVAYALWAEQAASLGVLTRDRLRGDAMGIFLVGGAAEVRAQAQEYGTTAAEVVEAARGTIVLFSQPKATLASALAGRGMTNSNKATQGRNPDVLRLGEQIGSKVMGSEEWKKYITTSTKHMNEVDKPVAAMVSQQWKRNGLWTSARDGCSII